MMPKGFPLANQSILKPTGLVADQQTGELIAFVSRSPLKDENGETLHERSFYANIQGTRRLGRAWFQLASKDDGKTWSTPKDITQQLIKKPHWQEWSPVHTGLQLQYGKHAGRLVVPVRCYCPDHDPSKHDLKFQTNSVIFSDDHGKTWIPGGRSQPRFGECSITELADGTICLNQRVSPGQPGFRWRAISKDGGETFEPTRKTDLPDQRCHAGICALEHDGRRILLLSSVPGVQRKQLTLSVSHDEGLTWDRKRVVHSGHAAYSDLVAMPNGTFVCVYETGESSSRRDLAVARFDLEWIMSER
jgi:sialidase-1